MQSKCGMYVTVQNLPPQSKPGDNGAIAIDVVLVEIREQASPSTDELQQPTARLMIVRMLPQVLDQAIDALGE